MENFELESELQKRDLKVAALLESISRLEGQVADLRVELTISEAHRRNLEEQAKDTHAPKED